MPKQPARTTDRRRGQKTPPAIKQPRKLPSLEETNKAYEDAAAKPFTPLFRDRRGS